MENYSRKGQATDGNMAHMYFTLGPKDAKAQLRNREIITALLLQKYLHERASVLRYMYIASLVRDLLLTVPSNKSVT